jgi:Ni/Fe-hydrogenase subunit HybB-like protein
LADVYPTPPPAPSGNTEPEGDRLIAGVQSYETITDRIGSIVLYQTRQPIPWYVMAGIGFLLLNLMMYCITYLLFKGVGIWGINEPSAWGFDIINFVWWIGIGHAGTLISAILLLLRQQWRTSINRFAEAMTLFAVSCAGLFPLLHTGRPWVAYWMFPYPNILSMWPQFRSPLIWDVFAVSTYATVSAVFWFIGLIPDLASLRDRATNVYAKVLFGAGALGWRGSAAHWQRYETAYLILAGLSTPLVLSVHSIVSFDFSVGIVPGWHTTIFPPYFVAGAVFAGFAMVITFAIPLRKLYHLEDYITTKHLDWMAKIMLTTGLIVAYGYAVEAFFSWYGGDKYEMYMMKNRMFTGPYAWSYWILLLTNVLIPQLMWKKKFRYNLKILFLVCQSVSIGMWFERFVIIPISLHRDFLPSSWNYYTPRPYDYGMFIGTIGQFIFLMFLFIRFLPMISIFEVRELLHHENHTFGHAGNGEEHGNVGATDIKHS